MRFLTITVLLLPLWIVAQDYTIQSRNWETQTEKQGTTEMLVVPVHPHYIISEVDRMITPEGMTAIEMREKLRQRFSMEMTRLLSDSLEALDLLISDIPDTEIDLLDYLYNAIDHRYVKHETEEEDVKKFKIPLPKKKDKRVYGAYATKENGQLKRMEVDHDRYMSVEFANPGAVDYLQDLYAFEHLLVVTQIEMRRNTEEADDLPYLISVHYEVMDHKGNAEYGGKTTKTLDAQDLEYTHLTKTIIKELAKDCIAHIWKQNQSPSPLPEPEQTLRQVDSSDY
ncbi:MAG: hypothetical protein HKN79_05835 [Flavobacteriales bacterium]|nr:hypothetical protein [Flavobacteriales bacterium]